MPAHGRLPVLKNLSLHKTPRGGPEFHLLQASCRQSTGALFRSCFSDVTGWKHGCYGTVNRKIQGPATRVGGTMPFSGSIRLGSMPTNSFTVRVHSPRLSYRGLEKL